MTGDDINAALEASEQAVLRRMAKRSVKQGGPAHYFSDDDTFDRIPGGMVVRRNNAVAPVTALPDGDEYGIKGRAA